VNTRPLFNGSPRIGALVSAIGALVLLAVGFTFNVIATLKVLVVACLIVCALCWMLVQIFGDTEDNHYGA
jgi:hypothetical protein